MSTASTRRTMLPRAAAGLAATVLSLGLLGCQPEPEPSPSSSPATASASPTTPTASPTPSETAQAGDDIELPTACEQIYSPEMLALLNQQNPPLNDPGVTMTSTQTVEALEILASGVPTIRCSWGVPSDMGLATNVSLIAADEADTIAGALAGAGFACTPQETGRLCHWEQTMISQDDVMAGLTETHVLRGNAWISTYTINFAPDGYTEDIVATLWG